MSPQFHLLILTRSYPYLPLALLRGRGQLLVVRQDDLRAGHTYGAHTGIGASPGWTESDEITLFKSSGLASPYFPHPSGFHSKYWLGAARATFPVALWM